MTEPTLLFESKTSRVLALLILASALFGLAVQFSVTYGVYRSVLPTLWYMLRYFTIVANLLAAGIFAGIAAGHPRFGAPALVGGITLTLLLVAIVYHLLLAGTLPQTAPEKLSDLFVHSLTPALVVLYWALCAPRGGLRRRDVPLWTVLPIAYFAYALARGAQDGIYPYPFMNVARLGWAQVGLNAAVIAIGFVVGGSALVWFDRRLAGPRG